MIYIFFSDPLIIAHHGAQELSGLQAPVVWSSSDRVQALIIHLAE